MDWKSLRILPYEGELADQPAWVVDMIQRAENAFEEERARRQKLTLAEMERNNEIRNRRGA